MNPAWLDLLKMLLGVPAGDTSQDAQIIFLATIAMEGIQERTGRSFIHGRFLDTIPGALAVVYLKEHPVEMVELVAEGGSVLDPATYKVNLDEGRITFANRCRCAPWVDTCYRTPMEVTYAANADLPPEYVSLVVADAIRAGMASMSAGNAYGFAAKRVAVTDVGSVEFGLIGMSPADSMGHVIDAGLSTWVASGIAGSTDCGLWQTSELLEAIPPVAAAAQLSAQGLA